MKSAILFLVFNRPDTTAKVFEAIRAAKPPRLYVAADGPRLDRLGELEQCEYVRKIVANIDWPCEVKTLFRDKNLGCKIAVSSGIDWFFQNEEEGIILEDDVVPHPDFFNFCEHILEKYRFDNRVMMATGTNYIPNVDLDDAYFFSQHYTIWGWATWRRAWLLYDVSMKAWDQKIVKNNIKYKFNDGYIADHFCATFDSLNSTYVDTWDIQWVFSCLYNSGLCATPRVNLITNIGVDGAHSSTVTDSHFLKTDRLDLKSDTNINKPVTVDAHYDSTLHALKTRPALRHILLLQNLKRYGMYRPSRYIYRKLKFIFS